jgi:single-strand DNA-binding protein
MINSVTLVGRVGQTPEIKTLESGQRLARLSIATSEKYTNKQGEKIEETDWHNVVVWGKLVDVIEKYVNKGDLLYLQGKLKTRSWEQDGAKRYATEVVLSGFDCKLVMLGGKREEASVPPPTADDLPY